MYSRNYHQDFLDKLANVNSIVTINKATLAAHSAIIDMTPVAFTEQELHIPRFKTRGKKVEIPLGDIYVSNIAAMHALIMDMDKLPEIKKEMLEHHLAMFMAALKAFFAQEYDTQRNKGEDFIIDEEACWQSLSDNIQKSINQFQEDTFKEWLLKFSNVGLTTTKVDTTLIPTIKFSKLDKNGEVVAPTGWFAFMRAGLPAMLTVHKQGDDFEPNMLNRMRQNAFQNLQRLGLSEESQQQAEERLHAIWNTLGMEQFNRFYRISQPTDKTFSSPVSFISLAVKLLLAFAAVAYVAPGSFFLPITILAIGLTARIVHHAYMLNYYNRDIMPSYKDDNTDASREEMLNLLYQQYLPKRVSHVVPCTSKDQSSHCSMNTVVYQQQSTGQFEAIQAKSTHQVAGRVLRKPRNVRVYTASVPKPTPKPAPTKPAMPTEWKVQGNPFTPPAPCYPIDFASTPSYGYLTAEALAKVVQCTSKKRRASLSNNLSALFKQVKGEGHSGVVMLGSGNAMLKLEGELGDIRVEATIVARGPLNEPLYGFSGCVDNSHKELSRGKGHTGKRL
jgi:hypothetical protein